MEDPNVFSSGTVGWILKKGRSLGKGILVSGLVLSSAPLVLPPLVVVSALGVAVSAPAGIILASYACADKLMSQLLATPQALHSNEEEINGDRDVRFNMDEEEEEMMEDTVARLETRLELGERGDENVEKKIVSPEKSANGSTKGVVEGNGNERDEGEYAAKDELTEGEKKEQSREETREESSSQVRGAVINVVSGDERKVGNPEKAIDYTIDVTAIAAEEKDDTVNNKLENLRSDQDRTEVADESGSELFGNGHGATKTKTDTLDGEEREIPVSSDACQSGETKVSCENDATTTPECG